MPPLAASAPDRETGRLRDQAGAQAAGDSGRFRLRWCRHWRNIVRYWCPVGRNQHFSSIEFDYAAARCVLLGCPDSMMTPAVVPGSMVPGLRLPPAYPVLDLKLPDHPSIIPAYVNVDPVSTTFTPRSSAPPRSNLQALEKDSGSQTFTTCSALGPYPGSMPQRCKVCGHPKRGEIDRD